MRPCFAQGLPSGGPVPSGSVGPSAAAAGIAARLVWRAVTFVALWANTPQPHQVAAPAVPSRSVRSSPQEAPMSSGFRQDPGHAPNSSGARVRRCGPWGVPLVGLVGHFVLQVRDDPEPGVATRSTSCSARRSAAGRRRPTATMTDRCPLRSRTIHARSGGRPREVAEPMSTSTVMGVSFRACRVRWERTRQAGEQN